jgi:hypothetical protein
MSVSALRRALLALSLFALVAVIVPVRAADEAVVPQADREAIEAIIKKRIADLANERDKDGIGIKRGTFSKSFKKLSATSYVVAFHQDTIEAKTQPDTDQLKTERHALTFGKGADGKWTMTKDELKDTYVGLYRGTFGGDLIYRFDALNFEKEGLKVHAGPGWAYGNARLGRMVGWVAFADDLKFDYAPPADTAETSHYSALNKKLAKEHPEDIVFRPERVGIICDAATCDEFASSVFTGLKKVGAGAGDGSPSFSRMQKRLDEAVDDDMKNRRDNAFSRFNRKEDPDNRFWRFTLKRDGAKDHFASLTYDNLSAWQMSYLVTGYGFAPLYSYYSEDTRNKGIDPLVLEERGDEESRDFDLVAMKGNVDLMLEDPSAYSGDVTFKLKIKRTLRELPFFIARVRFPGGEEQATKNPRMFINSVQDETGNELTWSRLNSFTGLVVLPKEMNDGDTITLRVQFLIYDAIYSLNPSFYGLARGGWLPFVRFGDFINDFDLTVRLPEKYEILGVGKVESNEIKDGLRVAHFTSPSPVTFPTIIFGDYISDDAGEYKVEKSDKSIVPVRVWVDKGSLAGLTDSEGATSGARDIRGKQLKAIATQASVALNLYREIYGVDYPFAKLDLVADPLGSFYGQAPASLIYLGYGVFRGEGQVASMSRNSSDLSKFNKDVVAHETGHQWWGGLVTNANDRNYWFVESMAELSSALYVERVYGKKKYLEKVEGWRQTIMENDPVNSVQNGYTTYAGSGFRSAVANIYNKGPYAFHIFRSTFGDEKFFQLLKELAQTLQHKEIVTREMQEVMEKVVGGNMDWFFDQWLRGVGLPQYAINWTKRKNEQGKWIVEGTVKQRVVFGDDKTELKGVYYRGVAPLTFIDSNGKETKAAKPLLVQGAETPFRVIVGEEPEQVLFNKDGEILAEDLLVNRSW